MSAGGADNMQFFITDLLEVIPNSKKVIVFLIEIMRGKQEQRHF